MFDVFTERPAEAYPDVYDVQVSFRAPALKRQLSDETVLDLGVYRNVLHTNRQDIHDVHKRLEELVAEAQALRKTLTPKP